MSKLRLRCLPARRLTASIACLCGSAPAWAAPAVPSDLAWPLAGALLLIVAQALLIAALLVARRRRRATLAASEGERERLAHALAQRLAHQAELIMLQVAQPAMDQLAGA